MHLKLTSIQISLDLDFISCQSFEGTSKADICGLSLVFADSSQSYTCGITNVYAWIAGTSGVAILIAQALLAIVIYFQPGYVPEKWHYFLVFQAINALVCGHNIFTLKKTIWVNDVSCAFDGINYVRKHSDADIFQLY